MLKAKSKKQIFSVILLVAGLFTALGVETSDRTFNSFADLYAGGAALFFIVWSALNLMSD